MVEGIGEGKYGREGPFCKIYFGDKKKSLDRRSKIEDQKSP